MKEWSSQVTPVDFCFCFQSVACQKDNRKSQSEFCLHRSFLVRLVECCLDAFIKNVTIYNVHLRCILPEVNQGEKKYCSSVRYFTQGNVFHLNLEDSPVGNRTV